MSDNYGVSFSYGILNSNGVYGALFLADKPKTYSIFGMDVSQERFEKVRTTLFQKLNGWFPKFNNAFELYVAAGGDWKKVDASQIVGKADDINNPIEAWIDMPKAAIDYVASLLEFDAKIFKRVTGIDVTIKTCCHKPCEYKFCPNCGIELK